MVNALKTLLRERHLHAYGDFSAEYRRLAHEMGLRHAPPTKAQYYRWVAGSIHNVPRGYHCIVLERMFPGWTAAKLFSPPETAAAPQAAPRPATAGLEPGALAGLWVTGYVFEKSRVHVDITTVTATEGGITTWNYPPQPRAEGYPSAHITTIDAQLVDRHLMGQWRNTNDAYYYGTVHLIVRPGEDLLDGLYTGFVTDSEILAAPWHWVRIDPASARNVDIDAVTLAEPRRIYETITGRTAFDGPITLDDVLD